MAAMTPVEVEAAQGAFHYSRAQQQQHDDGFKKRFSCGRAQHTCHRINEDDVSQA
jgi:hypothetical protein